MDFDAWYLKPHHLRQGSAFWGVSLNEIYARNLLLSYFLRTKWTIMQAYAVQGRLIGLLGLCVCYKFLTETITERQG
jgi:hypothetical protein